MNRDHPAPVCVIDDDPEVGDLFRLTLESRGIGCVICRDGEEALETIRRVRPSVVVLDLALPGRGGQEILADLQSESDLAAIPVIVVSGLTDGGASSDEAWRRKLGVAAYFSKPLAPRVLLESIQALMNQTSMP